MHLSVTAACNAPRNTCETSNFNLLVHNLAWSQAAMGDGPDKFQYSNKHFVIRSDAKDVLTTKAKSGLVITLEQGVTFQMGLIGLRRMIWQWARQGS